MKKHFVTFLSPGTFVHEETTKPIDSWNVNAAKEMAKDITERYSATPFAFQFSTRERKRNELDSKVVKTSGRYFLGGEVINMEEVKRKMPKELVLISNMECNGWDKIIMNNNSWRICQTFNPDDVVLEWTTPKKKKSTA